MKADKKNRKSILTRLVISFVLFLIGTVALYVISALVITIYIGNGSASNASPQTVVTDDGSIKDMEVLERIGGWVEELDSNGNVINVWGNKKTEKTGYDVKELAELLDLGYADYNSNGIVISKNTDDKSYSACIRCVGDPPRMYIVCYPAGMVLHKLTYMVNNGISGSSGIFLTVFLVLFIAVLLGISLYLKKHIERPLRRLMEGMDEVSEGKRDVVLDYNTDREFEEIRDKFNLMAEKLKDSEEEKRRLEQNRNSMLLELAHDIKNPVASIRSSISALDEGLVPDEKIKDYYRTIDMKAERIQTLTDDMNTSLKLESDDYKLDKEKTDICEVLRRICVEYYEDISNTGKDFEIDIPDEPIEALIDVKLFGRVIHNLLGNANKYDREGKLIEISLKKEPEDIVIKVCDDGEAIAEDFVPRMFEAFSRGDKSRKTDGGTGLGLAISRKIVEKHGGSLRYVRAEGKNCFCVRIACLD